MTQFPNLATRGDAAPSVSAVLGAARQIAAFLDGDNTNDD